MPRHVSRRTPREMMSACLVGSGMRKWLLSATVRSVASGQADAVADRHVHRFHLGLGADARGPAPRRPRPAATSRRGGAGRCVAADELSLRHAERRQVEQDAEVAGEPEAARVGDAVPVADHQLRAALQPAEGLEQQGHLAEGEQAGHVREEDVALGCRGLHHVQRGDIDGDRGGHRPAAADRVGDVHPGDRRGRLDPARRNPHPLAQPRLDPLRLAGIPRRLVGNGRPSVRHCLCLCVPSPRPGDDRTILRGRRGPIRGSALHTR
jgi:hypothetical protein